jgi:hypothetical protein
MTRASRTSWIAAAALTAAALLLPLWGFSMSAPQYPDETLHLRVTTRGISGDVQEVETLQQYIGVRFPVDLPELRAAVRAIAALTALFAVAALVTASGAGRAYRVACAVLMLAFVAASAAGVQRRLYEVGHVRDPHAPIRAVKDFTPPLVGPVKVGNFTVWSYPHLGGLALLAAAALTVSGSVGSRKVAV